VTTGGRWCFDVWFYDVIHAYQDDPDPDASGAGARTLHPQTAPQLRKKGGVPYLGSSVRQPHGRNIAGAKAVAMGGYNTYCEILSFDEAGTDRAASKPREERLIHCREPLGVGPRRYAVAR
jgi:hypothetical protein